MLMMAKIVFLHMTILGTMVPLHGMMVTVIVLSDMFVKYIKKVRDIPFLVMISTMIKIFMRQQIRGYLMVHQTVRDADQAGSSLAADVSDILVIKARAPRVLLVLSIETIR